MNQISVYQIKKLEERTQISMSIKHEFLDEKDTEMTTMIVFVFGSRPTIEAVEGDGCDTSLDTFHSINPQ